MTRIPRKRSSALKVAGVVVALLATTAAPQHAQSLRTPALDLTLGRHTLSGGLFDYHTGAFADLLVAGAVQSGTRWSVIAAGGGGAVVGGFGDRCLLRPGGGCAPKANFAIGNVLAGAGLSLRMISARALVGPAIYQYEGGKSLGAQGRLDLAATTVAHVGFGVMLRATLLPSLAGQRVLAWAVGGSIVVQ
jgi:hypothetical protein